MAGEHLSMPTHCPACGEALLVSGLVCGHCETRVEGHFTASEFALLPPGPLEFLRLFMKSRGNLKEVERILGLSYPTVRARFEQLLLALGYEYDPAPEAAHEERGQILDALSHGELSAEEAIVRLRALKTR